MHSNKEKEEQTPDDESNDGLKQLQTVAMADAASFRVPKGEHRLQTPWTLYWLNKNYLASGWSRDRVILEINKKGYPCFSGICSELYLEKCFIKKGLSPNDRLPIAKELGETSLMFLIDPTISSENMIKYVDEVKRVLIRAMK